MRINTQGLIDNVRHMNGQIIGLLILRPLGLRFGKEHRGQHSKFCHVAANVAADNGPQRLPYRVIIRT